MAYQQKNLSGSLWKNDKKREGKKDADYNGSCLINGEEFWVDSWINNDPRDRENYDPKKKTFLSLSFRPKDDARGRQAFDSPDPGKRQHDLSKPRHMPPPPLHNKEPEKYIPAKATDPEIKF